MITISIDSTFDDHLTYAKSVIAQGGPDVNQFEEHQTWYGILNQHLESGVVSEHQRTQLRDLFGAAYSMETLQGHAFLKPFGYAGDFELIEKIYQNHISPRSEFERYDAFFQAQPACEAVRNRKGYFKRLVLDRIDSVDQPLRILNLACGPCREVVELLDEVPGLPVSIHCVDVDARALRHAQRNLIHHAQAVTFERCNVFRYRSNSEFSLIWSSGLFDYFADRLFGRILHRILPVLAEAGAMVIGNFGTYNPSRGSMEALANWYLHHRSDQQLLNIAIDAVAASPKFDVHVDNEVTGINRFLHIQRSANLARIDATHAQEVPRPARQKKSDAIETDHGL